eukprot:c21905_g2_i1 orf=370-900(+)
MDLQLANLKVDPAAGGSLLLSEDEFRSDMLETNRGTESSSSPLIQSLIDSVNEIAVIGEYRKVIKKEGANLTRRVKLLAPLFEELKECRRPFSEKALTCLSSLDRALRSAKDVLRFCHEGSKIYLVLERETIISRFLAVTMELEQALDGLPYNALEISDEVREQVELVHSQLKRAK